MGVCFISSVVSYITSPSKTSQGILPITNTLIFIFTLLCFSILIFSKFKKYVIHFLSFEGIMLSFIFFVTFISGYSRSWMGLQSYSQLTLNFSNSNYAGIITATLFLIGIYSIFSFRNLLLKTISLISSILSMFLLILTSSRTPFISIFISIIFVILIMLDKKRRFSSSFSIFLVSFPIIFVAIYFLIFRNVLSSGITGSSGTIGGKEAGSRLVIWGEGISFLLKNPINIMFGNCFTLTGNFHNSFLTVMCSYGIITVFFTSLFLFVCFLYLFKNNVFKTKSQWIGLIVLFSIFLFGISEGTPALSSNGMYLIFIVSIAMVKIPIGKSAFQESFNSDVKINSSKVLIITNVYNYGSIGKIVKDCHEDNMMNNLDSYVIAGRGHFENNKNVIYIENEPEVYISKKLRRITKRQYFGNYFMTKEIIDSIKFLKPSIVHITALNDDFVNYRKLLKFLAKKQIKVVYTHHSEYMYLGLCGGHAYDCDLYINNKCVNCPMVKNNYSNSTLELKNNLITSLGDNIVTTSVSPWLHNRVTNSYVFKNVKDYVVLNGSGITVPEFDPKKFLKSVQLDDNRPIILHVNPSLLNKSKKTNDVLKIAEKNRDFQFVILTLKNNKSLNLPDNVRIFENITSQNELAKFYYISNVTLLTGTKETFSMPVIESLLCGTPVIGYECGGPESICESPYTLYSKNGNIDELSSNLRHFVNKKTNKTLISSFAKEKFTKEIMAQNYRKIYSEITNNFDLIYSDINI